MLHENDMVREVMAAATRTGDHDTAVAIPVLCGFDVKDESTMIHRRPYRTNGEPTREG